MTSQVESFTSAGVFERDRDERKKKIAAFGSRDLLQTQLKIEEIVAAAEWAAVWLSQKEGGVWKAGVREVWTAGEVHDALVFQTERAFCVLFVVRRWVTRVVAVEGMGGVEFGGC